MTPESKFQRELIQKINVMFPGCIILKNDANYINGIPDLIILHGNKWAALECKKAWDSPIRPNQIHYIFKMDKMSYAQFVFPENLEEVLDGLQRSFSS